MTATALFALTFLGGRRLGEISGIALVLLIVLVFMILARWQRHRSRRGTALPTASHNSLKIMTTPTSGVSGDGGEIEAVLFGSDPDCIVATLKRY
jgi:hypothetical protein